MKRTSLCLLLCSLAFTASLPADSGTDLMRGKRKTDRTILLEATVNAPPSEVFRLWSTPHGVQKFFAPAARIEPHEGGAYNILFAPKQDPEGNIHGTNGARILKFVPGEELDFEWITFAGDELLGNNAPPFAPADERNESPLPTWVELKLERVPGNPDQTKVHFAHYGFREGARWTESYRWFSGAWKHVLDQLVACCDNHVQSQAPTP